MTIDLTQGIKDENGVTLNQKYKSIIIDTDGKEVETLSSQPITLGRAIRDCIFYKQKKQDGDTEEEVLFAEDIYDKCSGSEVNLTKKEIDFIKKLVLLRYTQHSEAQILRMLNK